MRGVVLRVGVYVDAFNVYYGARDLCGRGTAGWRWLDVGALAMSLVHPHHWTNARLEKLVYCTAPRDREGDPSSSADQRTYVSALRQYRPETVVVNGRYAPRIKTGVLIDRPGASRVRSPGIERLPPWLPAVEVAGASGGAELLVSISTFEEKGSDVNVASNLLIDVLSDNVDAAMVLSNDSDLEFPLARARELVPVATINPSCRPVANALKGSPSCGAGRHWWRKVRADDLRAHQLPAVVGPYQRPEGW